MLTHRPPVVCLGLLLLLSGPWAGGGGGGGRGGGGGGPWGGVGVVRGLTCVGEGPCRCVFDDSSGTVDVSSLGNTDGTPRFRDVRGQGQLLYSYNPCRPFAEGHCSQAALCQIDTSTHSVSYRQIGDAQSVKWLNSTQAYVQLQAALSEVADSAWMLTEHHNPGAGGINVTAYYVHEEDEPLTVIRESFVTYVCDPGAEDPRLEVLQGDGTQVFFYRLTTQCACPDGCVVSTSVTILSGGTVLLIIFFVALAVYLTGGMILNRVRHQSKGLDLLPHADVWRSLPTNVKDGCLFVTSQFRRSKQTYTEVD